MDLALLCCRSLQVVDTSKGVADIPEWFRGSRLNYAENLLRHGDSGRTALYAARECRAPGARARSPVSERPRRVGAPQRVAFERCLCACLL